MSTSPSLKPFEEMMALSPSSRLCVFSYYNDNLGDHIQTLAMLQHVPVAELVWRDHMGPRPDLCLLANGWLSCGRMADPEHFRAVRYLGVHLAHERRNPLDAKAVGAFGPVGCRDVATRDYLLDQGLEAVLTGCATSAFPSYTGPREGVLCVDVSDEVKERATKVFRDPVFLTHTLDPQYRWRYYPEEIDPEVVAGQYRQAHEHLSKYMKAELVLTSRVHAALSSAALGTPVLYTGVAEEWDDRVGVIRDGGIPAIRDPAEISGLVAPRSPEHTSFLRERFLDFLRHAVAAMPAKQTS